MGAHGAQGAGHDLDQGRAAGRQCLRSGPDVCCAFTPHERTRFVDLRRGPHTRLDQGGQLRARLLRGGGLIGPSAAGRHGFRLRRGGAGALAGAHAGRVVAAAAAREAQRQAPQHAERRPRLAARGRQARGIVVVGGSGGGGEAAIDEAQVQTLVAMGFDAEQVREALVACGGNADAAAGLLLGA
mmetsp:Transcript_42022/g.118819  ORF Transcript_42022/g.118819 Transcript_42022/m.118819 type:complete len:185 (-) Transcript_42022:126-680(-)